MLLWKKLYEWLLSYATYGRHTVFRLNTFSESTKSIFVLSWSTLLLLVLLSQLHPLVVSQSVQNKALTIANIDLNTLASLQERRATALSSLFDRILSDSVPSHLLNFCSWPSVSAFSNRNLRNSAAVRLPRPKSSLLLSSPLYLAGSAFNHSCTSRA